MIAKKDTSERAWCELVGRGSSDIGVTQATKDMKIVIGWGRPDQKMMRCIAMRPTRPAGCARLCRPREDCPEFNTLLY